MSQLSLRALSGFLYAALVVFCTQYNEVTFYGLFFVFMLLCTFEFSSMTRSNTLLSIAISALIFLSVNSRLLQLIPIDIHPKHLTNLLLLLVFGVFIFYLLSSKRVYFIENLGKLFINAIYVAVPFALLCKIPKIEGFQGFDDGAKLVLGFFIMIWISDTFAFISGKLFGKHKLYESVSPGKTIEGFIGGTIFTILTGILLSFQFEVVALHHWIAISLIASVFGVLGDLVESMFKRQCSQKDSSNLLPGHGGFLDRLDSIVFATPFLYFYLQIIYY